VQLSFDFAVSRFANFKRLDINLKVGVLKADLRVGDNSVLRHKFSRS
jgi:hypothetical protein